VYESGGMNLVRTQKIFLCVTDVEARRIVSDTQITPPDLRKTPPCPDQSWLATNIFSSFDVSTDTSLSDKTVFAQPALPWERTILRKSGLVKSEI